MLCWLRCGNFEIWVLQTYKSDLDFDFLQKREESRKQWQIWYLNVVLWIWCCECGVVNVVLWMWYRECGVVNVVLWMWYCVCGECGILKVVSWMWCCEWGVVSVVNVVQWMLFCEFGSVNPSKCASYYMVHGLAWIWSSEFVLVNGTLWMWSREREFVNMAIWALQFDCLPLPNIHLHTSGSVYGGGGGLFAQFKCQVISEFMRLFNKSLILCVAHNAWAYGWPL